MLVAPVMKSPGGPSLALIPLVAVLCACGQAFDVGGDAGPDGAASDGPHADRRTGDAVGGDGARDGGGTADAPSGDVASVDGIPPMMCMMADPSTLHRPAELKCSPNSGMEAGCGITPMDECLVDTNCGSDKDCLCEKPPAPGSTCGGGIGIPAGNICVPANCRTDSDCSPCGLCEGRFQCGSVLGYYCMTPSDECSPTGPSHDYSGNGCTFDGTRWVRGAGGTCPG